MTPATEQFFDAMTEEESRRMKHFAGLLMELAATEGHETAASFWREVALAAVSHRIAKRREEVAELKTLWAQSA